MDTKSQQCNLISSGIDRGTFTCNDRGTCVHVHVMIEVHVYMTTCTCNDRGTCVHVHVMIEVHVHVLMKNTSGQTLTTAQYKYS